MKKIIALISVLPVLLALLLGGCTVDDPTTSTDLVAPAGEQLFANYVAIGNSLTAGYMDSGLSITGQSGSYPKLIADQIGATNFTQPYISLPGVGGKDDDDPEHYIKGVLYWNGNEMTPLGRTLISEVKNPRSGFLQEVSQATPYHNLGVPGALLHDVMNTYDGASSIFEARSDTNSFFDFINRASFFGNISVPANSPTPAFETASMFGACVAKGPKLLTCWIGNNEILGRATMGTNLGIVDPVTFKAEYTTMIMTLAGGLIERNGFPSTIVLGNIPSITDAAFFVQRSFLERPQELGGVGLVWPNYDEDNVEIVTLPGVAWIMAMAHAGNYSASVPPYYTLTVDENNGIEDMVSQYNDAIDQIAATVNGSGKATCGVFDANQMLSDLEQAQKTHFLFLEAAYGVEVAAGTTVFSLDGVHPNLVGYGMIANGFLDVIRTLTDVDVLDVDVSALSWDPTYGEEQITSKASGLGGITPEVAEGMAAIFR